MRISLSVCHWLHRYCMRFTGITVIISVIVAVIVGISLIGDISIINNRRAANTTLGWYGTSQ